MKIALIQQKATEDIEFNVQRGVEAANKAVEKGAKIICFAELAFTPFYPQEKSKGNNLDLAQDISGFITEAFCKVAKENGVVVIINLYEKDGDKTYDSSPVIGTNGEILGITRMLHITDYEFFYEKDYYYPGDTGVKVYNTEFGRIGVSICYDRHYPEYMRALAVEGAEIVFIPQAGALGEWPEGLYQAEVRTAAFQNGYFAALCNRVGKEKHLEFAGESFVCDPDGNMIAEAGTGTEEILFADIDLSAVKSSHAKRLFFRDRRNELYKEWFLK